MTLTPEGQADPLFEGVPSEFAATAATRRRWWPPSRSGAARHLRRLPGAGLPGRRNVYATQFHPELDLEGICTRIEVYKDAGYFDPSLAETLKETSRAVQVSHPMRLLANFVDLHKD